MSDAEPFQTPRREVDSRLHPLITIRDLLLLTTACALGCWVWPYLERIYPGTFWTILALSLPWLLAARSLGRGHPLLQGLSWCAVTLVVIAVTGAVAKTSVISLVASVLFLPTAAYLLGFAIALNDD